MGFDSVWHWILLLVIVLLVFGTKKIRNLGPDLGAAIRDFKKNLHGDDETADKAAQAARDAEQLRADPPSATPTPSSAAPDPVSNRSDTPSDK